VAGDPQALNLREALDLVDSRRDLLGEDHPETLDAMTTLARMYRAVDDYDSARRTLETILAIQTRVLGSDHIETTRTEFDLGLVYRQLGDLFSARHIQERVLESSDRRYGHDSELSIRAATNLATTLRDETRFDLELPLRERVVEARRRSVGSQHMDFYRALVEAATVHHNLHNYGLAVDLNQIVLDGFERNAVDRRAILSLEFNIVIDLIRLKRALEAAEVFERAYEEATIILPPGDPLRKQAEDQKRTMTLLGRHARKMDDRRKIRRDRKG
jgi:tetratricopeptide (TPR) repeat protein